MDYNKLCDDIVNWLIKYVEGNNLRGFVIGISGGIDSAVVSKLCALTGYDLLCLEIPIGNTSSERNRAKGHIKELCRKHKNVRSEVVDLSGVFETYRETLNKTENHQSDDYSINLSLANLKSRLRMSCLYSMASINNYIVAGTGNKVEDFGIGFFTKGGDGCVDISPIADLMKSQVYLLGEIIGINDDILGAEPTDGLWDGAVTDEEQIGASYVELEWAMEYLENNTYEKGIASDLSDRKKEVLKIYNNFHKKNKHKMVEVPIFKIK